MRFKTTLFVCLWATSSLVYAQLSDLSQAEALALEQDALRLSFQAQEQRWLAEGQLKSQLPDPVIKVGMANIPLDGFPDGLQLNQDPMSQLSIGLTQAFTRGDSRAITEAAFQVKAQQTQTQARLRALEVRRTVRQLWFSLSYSLKAQSLLTQQAAVFRQNLDNLNAGFRLGNSQSQDLLQAELQLERLNEKLAANHQQTRQLKAQLSRWLGESAWSIQPNTWPKWSLQNPEWLNPSKGASQLKPEARQQLLTHPALVMREQEVQFQNQQRLLVQESYSPAFKLDLNYGLRNSKTDTGNSRSDLLSVFVSVDLPLFTAQRQDQGYKAATQQQASAQYVHDDLLNQYLSDAEQALQQWQVLNTRLSLYQRKLLPSAKAQVEAAQQAYQSNTAPFDRLTRALIDELALKLEYEKLRSDVALNVSQLRFLQAL